MMTRRRIPGQTKFTLHKDDQERDEVQPVVQKYTTTTNNPKTTTTSTTATSTPSLNNKVSAETSSTTSSTLESLLQQQHTEILSQINFAMNAYGSSLNVMKEHFMSMLNSWNESHETFRKTMIELEKERMKTLDLILKHSTAAQSVWSGTATTANFAPTSSSPSQTATLQENEKKASSEPKAASQHHPNSKDKQTKQTPTKTKSSQTTTAVQNTKDASTVTTASTTSTSTTQTTEPSPATTNSKNAKAKKGAVAKNNTTSATTAASTNTTTTAPTATTSPTTSSITEIVIPPTKLFSQSHTEDKSLRIFHLRGDSSESIKEAEKVFKKLSLQNQVYALNILWNVKEEKATTREDNDTTPIVQMRYIVLCDATTIYLYKIASRAEMQQKNLQYPLPLSLKLLLTNNRCLKVGSDILEKVGFLYHNLNEIYVKPVAELFELPAKKQCTTFLELLSSELEVSTQTLNKELKWNDFSVDYSQVLSDAQAITEAKKVWIQYKVLENSFANKKQDGENLHAYACRVLNVQK
nr:unnamed protein product [Naegleria fowleri]